ncbi:MAG: R3H domain-containing nucleic acid-binding protein [bacterium]|nr:R3H domain-containing nucleic acid-binding protein [bacterium]
MEESVKILSKILSLGGFNDVAVSFDEERKRVSFLIEDDQVRRQVPAILQSLEILTNLVVQKNAGFSVMVDLNNYRKERERLIVELAKAAAHKALMTKEMVELPPMNAYERRLVHMEISANPSLVTESLGEHKDRRVVIRHID